MVIKIIPHLVDPVITGNLLIALCRKKSLLKNWLPIQETNCWAEAFTNRSRSND